MWGSFYILEVQKYTAITDLIVASELLKKKKKQLREHSLSNGNLGSHGPIAKHYIYLPFMCLRLIEIWL